MRVNERSNIQQFSGFDIFCGFSHPAVHECNHEFTNDFFQGIFTQIRVKASFRWAFFIIRVSFRGWRVTIWSKPQIPLVLDSFKYDVRLRALSIKMGDIPLPRRQTPSLDQLVRVFVRTSAVRGSSTLKRNKYQLATPMTTDMMNIAW